MNAVRPEFIRLPKQGTLCAYTGLSRTAMYNLCVPTKLNAFKPEVPAKQLKLRGSLRGTWHIPFDRLMEFFNALPTPGLAVEVGKSGVERQV